MNMDFGSRAEVKSLWLGSLEFSTTGKDKRTS